MEERNNQRETAEKNPLKKWVIILAILAGIFLCTTVYLAFFAKPTFNKEYIETVEVKENLQQELEILIAEHNKIKEEYGDLSEQLSEKDSVIQANADEIKKLINSQGDYNKIKKQLARLQNIAKEYVEEMDKLYEENKALKEENTQVKETLAQEREKTAAIEKDKEDLTQKITTASTLQAYNVESYAIYTKSKGDVEVPTPKANKAKHFKTTLILSENSLAEPGPVNVYCRIALPGDGRVLIPGSSDAYSFNFEGQKLQYTAKATINYMNKAENVSLYWDIRPDDKALKGKYTVEVYSDELFLGETYFILE